MFAALYIFSCYSLLSFFCQLLQQFISNFLQPFTVTFNFLGWLISEALLLLTNIYNGNEFAYASVIEDPGEPLTILLS